MRLDEEILQDIVDVNADSVDPTGSSEDEDFVIKDDDYQAVKDALSARLSGEPYDNQLLRMYWEEYIENPVTYLKLLFECPAALESYETDLIFRRAHARLSSDDFQSILDGDDSEAFLGLLLGHPELVALHVNAYFLNGPSQFTEKQRKKTEKQLTKLLRSSINNPKFQQKFEFDPVAADQKFISPALRRNSVFRVLLGNPKQAALILNQVFDPAYVQMARILALEEIPAILEMHFSETSFRESLSSEFVGIWLRHRLGENDCDTSEIARLLAVGYKSMERGSNLSQINKCLRGDITLQKILPSILRCPKAIRVLREACILKLVLADPLAIEFIEAFINEPTELEHYHHDEKCDLVNKCIGFVYGEIALHEDPTDLDLNIENTNPNLDSLRVFLAKVLRRNGDLLWSDVSSSFRGNRTALDVFFDKNEKNEYLFAGKNDLCLDLLVSSALTPDERRQIIDYFISLDFPDSFLSKFSNYCRRDNLLGLEHLLPTASPFPLSREEVFYLLNTYYAKEGIEEVNEGLKLQWKDKVRNYLLSAIYIDPADPADPTDSVVAAMILSSDLLNKRHGIFDEQEIETIISTLASGIDQELFLKCLVEHELPFFQESHPVASILRKVDKEKYKSVLVGVAQKDFSLACRVLANHAIRDTAEKNEQVFLGKREDTSKREKGEALKDVMNGHTAAVAYVKKLDQTGVDTLSHQDIVTILVMQGKILLSVLDSIVNTFVKLLAQNPTQGDQLERVKSSPELVTALSEETKAVPELQNVREKTGAVNYALTSYRKKPLTYERLYNLVGTWRTSHTAWSTISNLGRWNKPEGMTDTMIELRGLTERIRKEGVDLQAEISDEHLHDIVAILEARKERNSNSTKDATSNTSRVVAAIKSTSTFKNFKACEDDFSANSGGFLGYMKLQVAKVEARLRRKGEMLNRTNVQRELFDFSNSKGPYLVSFNNSITKEELNEANLVLKSGEGPLDGLDRKNIEWYLDNVVYADSPSYNGVPGYMSSSSQDHLDLKPETYTPLVSDTEYSL